MNAHKSKTVKQQHILLKNATEYNTAVLYSSEMYHKALSKYIKSWEASLL